MKFWLLNYTISVDTCTVHYFSSDIKNLQIGRDDGQPAVFPRTVESQVTWVIIKSPSNGIKSPKQVTSQ